MTSPVPQVREVVDTWMREYLCRPHPGLGRAGPVCPHVARALTRGKVLTAVWPHRPADTDAVTAVMLDHLRWFEGLPGRDDPDQALLVVFPGVGPADHGWAIEAAQRRLKTDVVRRGLMIGEFHDGPPDVPGVRNPSFRPLYSPVPLLAIRHMVRSDLPFLRDDPEHLTAYRARFAPDQQKADT